MDLYCLDRDILAVDPLAYLLCGAEVQIPAAGGDGTLVGTTFTDPVADFVAAGVAPGAVLTCWSGAASEGLPLEVASVLGETQLSVSILRPSVEATAIAPPAGVELSWRVVSLAAQIAEISSTLAETLRTSTEAAAIASADFADSAQLRSTAALGVLARIFLARAANGRAGDANWVKAEHYRRQFLGARNRLLLTVDLDGDGLAEETRSLGNVRLRRT